MLNILQTYSNLDILIKPIDMNRIVKVPGNSKDPVWETKFVAIIQYFCAFLGGADLLPLPDNRAAWSELSADVLGPFLTNKMNAQKSPNPPVLMGLKGQLPQ